LGMHGGNWNPYYSGEVDEDMAKRHSGGEQGDPNGHGTTSTQPRGTTRAQLDAIDGDCLWTAHGGRPSKEGASGTCVRKNQSRVTTVRSTHTISSL
jgi:hypothetical protein